MSNATINKPPLIWLPPVSLFDNFHFKFNTTYLNSHALYILVLK